MRRGRAAGAARQRAEVAAGRHRGRDHRKHLDFLQIYYQYIFFLLFLPFFFFFNIMFLLQLFVTLPFSCCSVRSRRRTEEGDELTRPDVCESALVYDGGGSGGGQNERNIS